MTVIDPLLPPHASAEDAAAPRAARPRDLPHLALSLARAFETDPVLRWLLPRQSDRTRRAPLFYRAVLEHLAPVATILTAADGLGVAVWQAPRPPRPTLGAEVRYGLRMLATLRGGALRGLRLVAEIETAHPRMRHWYLSILGTDPSAQRRGIGSQLLDPILRRCDADGLPAYLESSKESNLAFYGRHGFEVIGEVRVADGPTLWPMMRQSRRR